MDLGFFRRGRPNETGRSSAELDYGVLKAALEAIQSASVTARVQAQSRPTDSGDSPPQDALAEILLGGAGWREAVDRQGGSFNVARARSGGDDA